MLDHFQLYLVCPLQAAYPVAQPLRLIACIDPELPEPGHPRSKIFSQQGDQAESMICTGSRDDDRHDRDLPDLDAVHRDRLVQRRDRGRDLAECLVAEVDQQRDIPVVQRRIWELLASVAGRLLDAAGFSRRGLAGSPMEASAEAAE